MRKTRRWILAAFAAALGAATPRGFAQQEGVVAEGEAAPSETPLPEESAAAPTEADPEAGPVDDNAGAVRVEPVPRPRKRAKPRRRSARKPAPSGTDPRTAVPNGVVGARAEEARSVGSAGVAQGAPLGGGPVVGQPSGRALSAPTLGAAHRSKSPRKAARGGKPAKKGRKAKADEATASLSALKTLEPLPKVPLSPITPWNP